MTAHLTYRAATLADIEQLKQLGILAYGQYAGLLSPDGWEKMRTGINNDEMWLGLLQRSRSFLCTHGDTIAGMAFLMPSGNPWDVYPADWSYIRMVGVHPQYVGRGIARTLTQQCIDHARSSGEHTIALHTSEVMNAARHIYESMGFTMLREIATRFDIRYWLFTMPLTEHNE
ncbi:hypothetical protein GCM10023093_25000 [Nemorincola caseinilytica]|uniref:N-acetyltransferase domain-containing protein n=1 Tax=Nemorincola caseinilytica TaxID=2054315 RepID=A0ABP8NML8_9BACT